jgi:hypothetical protein
MRRPKQTIYDVLQVTRALLAAIEHDYEAIARVRRRA